MNITLHGKRDIKDVIKLRILRQVDYLKLLRWVQSTLKGHYKEERMSIKEKKSEFPPNSRNKTDSGEDKMLRSFEEILPLNK